MDFYAAGQKVDLPDIVGPVKQQIDSLVTDLKDLKDKIAQPFKNAAQALKDFGSGIRSVNPLLDAFANRVSAATDRVKEKFQELFDKFKEGGGLKTPFSMGLDAVTGIVSGLWKGVTAFARMALDAASFREESVAGFKAILGSAEQANALFNHALEVAKLTKYETEDVVNMYNGLVAKGFKQEELDTVTAAMADVSSARGEATGKRFELALSKMRGAGIAKFGTYQQAYMAGGGAESTNRELAKLLNLKETDPGKLSAKINEMMRAKQISSNAAILANLNAVEALYDPKGKDGGKGKLGEYALAQSQTLKGLFSTAKSAFGDLVMGLDVSNLPGIQSFRNFLKLNLELLNSNTSEGKRLQEIVKNLINDIFGVFDMDPGKTKSAFNVLLDIAEKVEKRIKIVSIFIRDDLIPGILDLLKSLGEGSLMDKLRSGFIALAKLAGQAIAVGFLAAVGWEGRSKTVENELLGKKEAPEEKPQTSRSSEWVDPFAPQPEAPPTPQGPDPYEKALKEMQDFGPYVGAAKGGGRAVGQGFGLGLGEGLEDSLPIVKDNMFNLGQKAEDHLRDTTGTHSPSENYRKVGRGWGQGVALGVMDTSQDVENALASLGGELGGAGGGKGSGIIIEHLEMNIYPSAGMDEEELGDLVVEKLRFELGLGDGRMLRNPTAKNL